MGNKKTKINILIILIVIFLLSTLLMIRFEFNPISFITGGNNDKDKDTQSDVINYNGIYRYKDSLNKTYKLYDGCSVSYFDYYIVILNDEYNMYKSSCIGTFFLRKGETKNLVIEKTLENNLAIKYDDNSYLRTDLVSSVEVGNRFRSIAHKSVDLSAEDYHLLFENTLLPGNFFEIPKGVLSSGAAHFPFTFTPLGEDDSFEFKILGDRKKVLYRFTGNDFNQLPHLRNVSSNLSIIEPKETDFRYHYTLKVFTEFNLIYDINNYFPITVDGDELTTMNSIYIKYLDGVYVMLIGNNKEFCAKKSTSTDVAYYVFHIEYDHVVKALKKPIFIKKVLKNDSTGCQLVEKLMEE